MRTRWPRHSSPDAVRERGPVGHGLDRDAHQPDCSRSSTSRRLAELARGAGALTVVDNTFATPFLQRPLELGADVVLHSATKYLGGHSDVVGGLVATNRDDLAERLRFHQNAAGAVPSPFDCWLVLRGMRTLAVRMERACANARAIAYWLDGRPEVRPRLLPRPARQPAARAVRAPDAAARRHGQLRAERRRRGRAPLRELHPPLHAGGVAGRGGVADRAAGGHDPPLGRRLAAGRAAWPGPPVGRDRVVPTT